MKDKKITIKIKFAEVEKAFKVKSSGVSSTTCEIDHQHNSRVADEVHQRTKTGMFF